MILFRQPLGHRNVLPFLAQAFQMPLLAKKIYLL